MLVRYVELKPCTQVYIFTYIYTCIYYIYTYIYTHYLSSGTEEGKLKQTSGDKTILHKGFFANVMKDTPPKGRFRPILFLVLKRTMPF